MNPVLRLFGCRDDFHASTPVDPEPVVEGVDPVVRALHPAGSAMGDRVKDDLPADDEMRAWSAKDLCDALVDVQRVAAEHGHPWMSALMGEAARRLRPVEPAVERPALRLVRGVEDDGADPTG